MTIDLKEIEKSIDEMIANDNPDEMLEWLAKKRSMSVKQLKFNKWLKQIYRTLILSLFLLSLVILIILMIGLSK